MARCDGDRHAAVDVGAAVAVVVRVVAGCARPGGREAVGLVVAGAKGVGHRVLAAAGAGNAGAGLARGVAAGADRGAGVQSRFALAREDLDHAADGIGAVQGAQGAVDDFDAVDGLERNGVPAGGAAGRGADAHAVEQHHDLVGIRAAQVDAGAGAGTAVARDLDAGLALQHVGHRAGAGARDFLGLDDGGLGDDGVGALRRACRGDDDGVDGRRDGCGVGARERRGHGEGERRCGRLP